MKINFFILYRSPKTFHENIVIHPTTAIHANANLYLLKMTDELHTGELNPLVCIKDLGLGGEGQVSIINKHLSKVEIRPQYQFSWATGFKTPLNSC
jgi:hypothetical protein